MKNLATCKPTEFVAQTARIRNAVANWVDAIDLMKIRARTPKYETLSSEADAEQRAEVIKKNAEILKKHTWENFNKLMDNMLVKHPQETLEVLALCCFVEPENVDDYSMDEYLQCIMDMAQNKSVLNFFSLLAQLQTVAKST